MGYTYTKNFVLIYLTSKFSGMSCAFICSVWQPCLRGLPSPCSSKHRSPSFHFCDKQDVTGLPSTGSGVMWVEGHFKN